MTFDEAIQVYQFCYGDDLRREGNLIAKQLKQKPSAAHVRAVGAVMIQKPKLATALVQAIGPLVDDPNPVQRLRRDEG